MGERDACEVDGQWYKNEKKNKKIRRKLETVRKAASSKS